MKTNPTYTKKEFEAAIAIAKGL